MAKFGISAAFNNSFIASVQLTPALYQASIFGFNNMSARLVTVLAPEVAEIEGVTPLLINIIVAGIAAVASLFLI